MRTIVTPTGACGIAILLAAALAMIGLRAANPWLLLIGCALIAPVLVSWVLGPDLASIEVGISALTGVPAAAGQGTDHVLRARNLGRRSSPALLLTHRHACFQPVAVTVPALAPGAAAEVAVRRTAVHRGAVTGHRFEISSTAPFGLGVHRRELVVPGSMVVHPAPAPAARLVPPGGGGSTGVDGGTAGGTGGRAGRDGIDAHELREWRPGDPLRQVHWRATARYDRLTVVVPDDDVVSGVALVIHGSPADEGWEQLIAVAAATAAATARSGGTVHLLAVGTEVTADGPGAVLDWFAALPTAAEPARPHQPGPDELARLLALASAGADGTVPVVVASTTPLATWPGPLDLPVAVLHRNGEVTRA